MEGTKQWCTVVSLFLCYCCFTEANDCHYDISTEVYPSMINYIGMGCTWNITAPSPFRVSLTIDEFRLLSVILGPTGEEATYEVSDEVGKLGPFPIGHTASTFHSDYSLLVLTAKTSPNLNYADFELIATIRKVVELYFCDFEEGSDCTDEVDGDTDWLHGRGIDTACPVIEGSPLTDRGLFYNPPSASGTSRLMSRSLEKGKYFVELSVFRACADRDTSSVTLRVTFCEQQWNRTIGVLQSGDWRPYNLIMDCQDDFEVTLQTEHTGSSGVVVALDDLRISRLLDPVGEPTVSSADPVTTGSTIATGARENDDDVDYFWFLIGGGAIAGIMILSLVVVVCVCLCKRKEKKRSSSSTTIPVSTNNHTNNVKIAMRIPANIRRKLSSYDEVIDTDMDNPTYQGIEIEKPIPAPRTRDVVTPVFDDDDDTSNSGR